MKTTSGLESNNQQQHPHQEGQQANIGRSDRSVDSSTANSRQVSNEEKSDDQQIGDDRNRQNERLVQQ